MSTELFYSKLLPLNSFLEIANSQNFWDVPDDWYILVSDIVGSTKAIASGRYKAVNIIGASSIVAVLNIAKKLEIPYVFGGDGASLVVPPTLLHHGREALLATRQLARVRFGMNLRVGAVPVSVVRAARYELKVAKLKVSEHYHQANFTGGGLTYATDLVKDDSPDNLYQLRAENSLFKADLSGLECRWQDIPSEQGHAISLIVTATPSGGKPSDRVYQNVIRTIQTIYGNPQSLHPVRRQHLKLTLNPRKLNFEMHLKARSHHWRDQLSYLANIGLQNLLGLSLMTLNAKLGGVDWGLYKEGVIATTDYQKFDDLLRMVIMGSPSQTAQLNHYLEQEYKAGQLAYGIHVSDRVLMTCLVFERNGRQVHFIDGADGGYTLAAQAMKQRLHRKALNWKTYNDLLDRRNRATPFKSKPA